MAQFQQRTGTVLNVRPPKTLEDITRQIDIQQTSYAYESNEQDLKTRAKTASMNVLYCLRLLGGVAAQGASMVFAPASLCFNAVSILLDIPSKLHDFHAVVDGLFEQISVFLSQFRIYQRIEQFSEIDPDLNDTIHRLMISFVSICALSVELRNGGKWGFFKRDAKKVLFDDDSSVSKELGTFKYLVDKQGNIRDTLALEHILKSEDKLSHLLMSTAESQTHIADIEKGVENIGKGVSELTNAENDRKSEQTKKELLTKITKKLAVKDEVVEANKKAFNEFWAESVEGGGQWLCDLAVYTDWVNPKTEEIDPVLLLTGEASCGKSFLSAVVAHDLLDRYGEKSSVRTSLAYHFFPKYSDKINKDQKPAETALKAIALQLAEHNMLYRKSLAQIVDTKDDGNFFRDSSCQELWDTLKLASTKADCTFFLIFDGLDQCGSDAKALIDVLNSLKNTDVDRSQLRVLATGTSDTLSDTMSPATPMIEIQQNNETDVKKYIERQLKKRDLLQGNNTETVKFRTSIYDRLPDLVHGSFFKTQITLDKIDETIAADGSSSELERILDEANQDGGMIAKNAIAELSESLSAKEIEEVNELLIWVIYGFEYFYIDELEAALFLRFEKTSLQPLEKKLKKKYPKIFGYEGFGITIDSDVQDAVEVVRNSKRMAEDSVPRISATIQITNADMRSVQSFLWRLNEKAVIENFVFDQTTTATTLKGSIHCNEMDAHLSIVKQTFKLLTADPDDRTSALSQYLLDRLPDHLDKLYDAAGIDELTPADKREIGKGLFNLLEDGETLERFWWHRGNTRENVSTANWVIDHSRVDVFWKWLDDPEATRTLGKKDKEWLQQQKSASDSNRALMRPTIVMVAKNWLQGRDWVVDDAFLWLQAYLQRVSLSDVHPTYTVTDSQ